MAGTKSENEKPWCCRRPCLADRSRDHGVPTVTSEDQINVEDSIAAYYEVLKDTSNFTESSITLDKKRHALFLRKGLRKLSQGFVALDASRTWIVYWCVHGLHLLQEPLEDQLKDDIVDFLARCQCDDGGFGGGPGQLPHLAPTYAAINALVTVGTPQALAVIDRQKLANFLASVCNADGSFLMHEGGEVDIRGAYCAVAVARLTKLTLHPLFARTPAWIVRCQTFEGGFGGGPGMEAHGGYTFCGFAALALLHCQNLADNDALLRWVASRQMRYSGGFQGRTNKLVDGCYSFWQGGLFPILHHTLAAEHSLAEDEQCWLFQVEALQNYLLVCCQSPRGGLIDKPGKSPDYYHTCYTLSGLSIAQHYCYENVVKLNVVGDQRNELALTHPLHNVGVSAVLSANKYFSEQPSIQPADTSCSDGRSATVHELVQDTLHISHDTLSKQQKTNANSSSICSNECDNSKNKDSESNIDVKRKVLDH